MVTASLQIQGHLAEQMLPLLLEVTDSSISAILGLSENRKMGEKTLKCQILGLFLLIFISLLETSNR